MSEKEQQQIVTLQKEVSRLRRLEESLKDEANDSKEMIYILEEMINFSQKTDDMYKQAMGKNSPWHDLLQTTIKKAEDILRKVKK